MDHVLSPLVRQWDEDGVGVEVEGGPCIHHVIWTDNISIVVASREQGAKNMVQLTKALYETVLYGKPGSLQ
eukprot:2087709-Karenia_brevis.AAC.1